jgi:acyl-CoA synthetase (AMP-forming)/AMP-acid ligase II
MLINQVVRGACDVEPGVPAFVALDGREVRFGEFGAAVRRVAGAISVFAPRPGACIGILALNSIRYLEAYFGAMWAGRVAVPLNVRWSLAELVYALADAGIEVLFVDEQFASLVPDLRAGAPRIRYVVYLGEHETPVGLVPYADLEASEPVDAASVTADTVASVVYTGGTTAFPKGVMHTQGSLLASALNCVALGTPPRETRYALAMPLFHVGGYALAAAQLLQRGTVVVLPLFKPDLVRRAVRECGAEYVGLVPTMLGMLMDADGFDAADYRHLRGFAYGASPIPAALLQRAMETFPHASFTQVYGMTEVGVVAMLHDRWHRGPDASIAATGQPGPFYSVSIVDADGRELPRGQMGELVIRGPGVMRGYLNRPEATAEALRDGGMHSGDAGIIDAAGVVTLLDRVKDMIVTGAENVYSVEVESAVSQHPSVAQCAVIGLPDARYGERVHAVVVLRAGTTLTLEELRAHCTRLIAGYKCPRSFEVREVLPLSALGKVLKSELREPHWQGHARRVN